MISNKEVVIVLSNSGETNETIAILPSLKKIGAKTISITKSHESTLAKQSDISITYHYDKEADHLNLAPTVTTSIALAIGDALAVALSIKKGFTREDFHVYHPGGALGRSLEKKVKI